MKRRARILVLFVAVLVSCGPADADRTSSSSAITSEAAAPTIVIGSDATIELELMAEVYAQAVEAAGYPVRRTAAGVASLNKQLAEGALNLAPAQLDAQLRHGGLSSSGDATEDADRLQRMLSPNHLIVLTPSKAEWTTGFAMLDERASEHHLATVTELAHIAENLTWGLPGDCATLAGCADVLAGPYGVDLGRLVIERVPVCDAEAATALNDARVDVALLCTTQPEVERFNLVVLEDDRHAQPSGEIVPILNQELLALAGENLSDTLNAISTEMTTAELTSLVARTELDGESVMEVARTWLGDHGLR